MLRTILFDLDGTLVHFEFDDFLKAYLGAISNKVAQLVDARVFVAQLLASTEEMVKSLDPTRTNQDVFADHFFSGLGRTEDELMPVFDAFYDEDFPHLRDALGVEPHPWRDLCSKA